MNFIKHTINWCKGEIFEGQMILLLGILFLVITFSFWKFGTMPGARAFVIPTILLSLLLIGTGVSMNVSNQKRMASFTASYNKDPQKFISVEKERTEAFMKWYSAIRYIGAGILIIGLLIFLFTITPLWKSISLCLMVMAIAVFVIDYFSEERAKLYYALIINAL